MVHTNNNQIRVQFSPNRWLSFAQVVDYSAWCPSYLQLAENFRNFLTKNNTAPTGIKRANNSNKYAKSPGSSWIPTIIIPNIIIITDGIANASINSSKYLFISTEIGVVVAGDLVKFWILSPKINDDVPINKETIVKVFCVIAGISVIDVLVSSVGDPCADTNCLYLKHTVIEDW